jgi:5-methylcytosine-specific restriction endonuclease McrA
MILTKELLKPFMKNSKVFLPRRIEKLGFDTSTKGWTKNIIGEYVNDDVYNKVLNKIINYNTYNKKKQNKQSDTKTSDKNTKEFINLYIENMCSNNIYGGLIPEWIHADIKWDEVRIRLMKLPYDSFLKTYYWRAIGMYLKYKNGEHCTYCNCEKGLQIHHKTYEHHGLELFYLDDLEVLCDKCHKMKH